MVQSCERLGQTAGRVRGRAGVQGERGRYWQCGTARTLAAVRSTNIPAVQCRNPRIRVMKAMNVVAVEAWAAMFMFMFMYDVQWRISPT